MLTLFHTNDFHNRLTQAQANRLRLLRESAGINGLLLDAGDAVGCGNLTFRPGGEPILERMTLAGYDAMTVGNREFHLTKAGFEVTLSRARFPVLSANMRLSGTPPVDFTRYLEREIANREMVVTPLPALPFRSWTLEDGEQVVVMGLTVPMITETMLSRKISSYVFEPPLTAAARLVPLLRHRYPQALFVALNHIGLRQDRLLAETVPGIDLIVGGHSHDTLPQGEWAGNTLIVQTGCYASKFGRVKIERQAGKWHLEAALETL